jgi:acyl carrier protein
MSSTQQPKKSVLQRWFGPKAAPPPRTADEITTWLIGRLAAHFEIDPAEIDVHEAFTNYGLDSRTAVGLSGELETWLGRQLPATLVWDYPSIDLLAKNLADAEQPAVNGQAEG